VSTPTDTGQATGLVPETATRSPNLVLARIHLRFGLFGLARAELEALAGRDALDVDALLDLAEARWRTGDVPGAGDAAQAYLESGGDSALGYVIAAEAVAAIGRPTEARRLASEALTRAGETLDALFAGTPRSLIWPADSSDAGLPAGALFEEVGTRTRPEPAPTGTPQREAPSVSAAQATPVGPTGGPGLWDATEPTAPPALPTPQAELELGRAAIAAGDAEGAAGHLGVALRLSPALAPAVLDAAGAVPVGGSSPALELVRGDAYRSVGHESEARRAYASAAEMMAAAGSAEEESPTDPSVGPVAHTEPEHSSEAPMPQEET
jgi:tetratricopeptide (TPR) repeat protein